MGDSLISAPCCPLGSAGQRASDSPTAGEWGRCRVQRTDDGGELVRCSLFVSLSVRKGVEGHVVYTGRLLFDAHDQFDVMQMEKMEKKHFVWHTLYYPKHVQLLFSHHLWFDVWLVVCVHQWKSTNSFKSPLSTSKYLNYFFFIFVNVIYSFYNCAALAHFFRTYN